MSDQVISKQYFDKAIEGMNRYHVLCEGFQADLATAQAEIARLTAEVEAIVMGVEDRVIDDGGYYAQGCIDTKRKIIKAFAAIATDKENENEN